MNINEIRDVLHISQSWDTAISENNRSDYTVCITFMRSKTSFYVLDIFRKKISYPELKKAIVENAKNGEQITS